MLPRDQYELRRRAEARGRRGRQRWLERDPVLRALVARLLEKDEPGSARSVEPGRPDRLMAPP